MRAGQALADIETPELDQQIHEVEAELVTAKANDDLDRITAERWQKMLAAQSVSQQEADEKAAAYSVSKSRVNAAQANLERLKALAAFKHVVAPFDGIVTARNTDVGNLINAGAGGKGAELFRIADEHEARIYVDVPQTDAGKITVGLSAQLELPENPGVLVPAKVADLSQALSIASRTMQVELLADNANHLLLPGDYVSVHFQIPAPLHVLELPTTSLIFRKEGLQVAIVDNTNHVALKPIQIAQERGSVVNVNLGLTHRIASSIARRIQSPMANWCASPRWQRRLHGHEPMGETSASDVPAACGLHPDASLPAARQSGSGAVSAIRCLWELRAGERVATSGSETPTDTPGPCVWGPAHPSDQLPRSDCGASLGTPPWMRWRRISIRAIRTSPQPLIAIGRHAPWKRGAQRAVPHGIRAGLYKF